MVENGKAYQYATWCVTETEGKVPRYVKLQAQQWLDIADGKNREAIVDESQYDKICKLLKLLVHPDLHCSIYEGLEDNAWLFITAVLCTVCRPDTDRYKLSGADPEKIKIRYYETAILEVCRKNHKALSLDTPIPTPDGWKTMDEVRPGDFVFARNGKPTRVTGESEIFYKPMFLVRFEDGAEIKASADHIWTVQSRTSKITAKRTGKHIGAGKIYRKGGWYDMTTAEMQANFRRRRSDGKGVEYNYRVPMNGPVAFPEKDLPVDPYLFGVWLGNGHTHATYITTGKTDLANMLCNLKDCGYKLEVSFPKDRAPIIMVDTYGRGKQTKNGLKEKLKIMGVLRNKHIPQAFMEGSIEQRTALLQGLMDTDGHCSLKGQCRFVQKNKKLSEQVKELAASLGIKASIHERTATLNGKDCGKVYEVSFFVDKAHSCFRLQRKHERLKDHLSERMGAKTIVDIVPIEAEPSKCIMVDDDEHLYLAGKAYTPTHNTFNSAVIFILLMLTELAFSRFFSVAPDLDLSSELQNAIKKIIKSSPIIYDDEDPAFKLLRKQVRCLLNDNEYTPLAYSRDGMDGRLAQAWLADEAGALDDYPVEAMRSSQIEILSKLGIIISTQYPNDNNVLMTEIDIAKKTLDGLLKDTRYFALLYEPDEELKKGDVWMTDDRCIYQSNPVAVEKPLVFDNLVKRRTMAVMYENKRENYLCKHNNIRYKGLGVEGFVDIQKVRLCAEEIPDEFWRGKPVWCGLDLSQTDDNTSLAMVTDYEDTIYAKVFGFIPVDAIDKKTLKEKVDYRDLIRRGECFACGDEVIDYGFVERFIIGLPERYGVEIMQLGYDRYNAISTVQKLEEASIECVEIKQHSSVLHPATKLLKECILKKSFKYADNRMLEINFQNARCTKDTNQNLYVNKKKSEGKVDMVVSTINAIHLLQQEQLFGDDGFVIQTA